ncbi:MAG: AbrB/MazE/SpoVT family DNA-binding domain-containing protein [Patescibacteria group bacterium]
MTQKVLKVGDSAAVIIPKKSLEELGLKIGDKVIVEINRRQHTVLIEPFKNQPDKELLEWTRKFIAKYRTALKALAGK